MAMSEEELKLQLDILTTKTSDNPDMVYKASAITNKGLNPEYFTGNNTKIVNAINYLAEQSVTTTEVAQLVAEKVNEVLLDISNYENSLIDTIIEGIQRILQGKQQDKILGITPDDIGKILSVAQAEDGEMMVKAIDNILNPSQMEYTIEEYPEVQTVENALDKLFELQNNKIDEVTWDMILNKPAIPTGLELTNEALVMNDDDGEMSSVPLMTDEDINILINELGI